MSKLKEQENGTINIIENLEYKLPRNSAVKIGGDPTSKDKIRVPNPGDPATVGQWGKYLNDNSFIEIEKSFAELKKWIDSANPLMQDLIKATNFNDWAVYNNNLKGFGLRADGNVVRVIGYDPQGVDTGKSSVDKKSAAWFYLKNDKNAIDDLNGDGSPDLVAKRTALKLREFSIDTTEAQRGQTYVLVAEKAGKDVYIPELLYCKLLDTKLIPNVPVETTVWDKATEALTAKATVDTGLSFLERARDQHKWFVAGSGLEYKFSTPGVAKQLTNEPTVSWVGETVGATQEVTHASKEYKDVVVLGMFHVAVVNGQVEIEDLVTNVVPTSFIEHWEASEAQRELHATEVRTFEERFKTFKKIEDDKQFLLGEIKETRANIEQTIRESLLKRKSDELFLEYYNNNEQPATKWDVESKGKPYGALKGTRRLLSAELDHDDTLKEVRLHGDNSEIIVTVGSLTDEDAGVSIKTGVTLEKNLNVGLDVNVKKDVNVTEALNVGKTTTSEDLVVTKHTKLNTLAGSGLADFAANVLMGNSQKGSVVRSRSKFEAINDAHLTGQLDLEGTTHVLGKELQVDVKGTFDDDVLFKKDIRTDGVARTSNIVDSKLIKATKLEVGETTLLKGVLTAEDHVVFKKDLELEGKGIFSDDLDVAKHVNVQGDLSVEGATTLEGRTLIEGNLIASEPSTFEMLVTLEEDLLVEGDTNLVGSVKIEDSLTVEEGALFKKAVSVNDDLAVVGDTTLAGVKIESMNVSGKSEFGDDVLLQKNLEVDEKLTVKEVEVKHLDVTVEASVKALTVSGKASFNALQAKTTDVNKLKVTGSADIHELKIKNIDLSGTLKAHSAEIEKLESDDAIFKKATVNGTLETDDLSVKKKLTTKDLESKTAKVETLEATAIIKAAQFEQIWLGKAHEKLEDIYMTKWKGSHGYNGVVTPRDTELLLKRDLKNQWGPIEACIDVDTFHYDHTTNEIKSSDAAKTSLVYREKRKNYLQFRAKSNLTYLIPGLKLEDKNIYYGFRERKDPATGDLLGNILFTLTGATENFEIGFDAAYNLTVTEGTKTLVDEQTNWETGGKLPKTPGALFTDKDKFKSLAFNFFGGKLKVMNGAFKVAEYTIDKTKIYNSITLGDPAHCFEHDMISVQIGKYSGTEWETDGSVKEPNREFNKEIEIAYGNFFCDYVPGFGDIHVENFLEMATEAQAIAGVDGGRIMSPLRTKQLFQHGGIIKEDLTLEKDLKVTGDVITNKVKNINLKSVLELKDAGLILTSDGLEVAKLFGSETTFAAPVNITSDERAKENFELIESPIEKVKQITGYTYNRIGFEKREAGVKAQEVLKVIPEVVGGSEEAGYSVSYGSLVPLLLEAIKEQQKQIDDLKELIGK